MEGDAEMGIRVQARGRCAGVSWGRITAPNLSSFWPLRCSYLFKSLRLDSPLTPGVHALTHTCTHAHTHRGEGVSCESRGKKVRGEKKRIRRAEMGGLGRCALYAAGARR